MSEPREFWINLNRADYPVTFNQRGFVPTDHIHVREVIPDDEKGDKYLAMCKYVDLKNEELARVTRALEKAKIHLSGPSTEWDNERALKEIEAIERGE